LGFKEAFTFKDTDGKVTTCYIRMNKENFLEIARAAPDRPAGLNHVVGICLELLEFAPESSQRKAVDSWK